MKNGRPYLMVFAVSSLVLCMFVIGFQYYLHINGMLPPVPVSTSLSFNEKVAFLAKKKAINCKILASGSSITLDNLDSEMLAAVSGGEYLNISSWGMSVRENYLWLNEFVNYCKPEVIVMVSLPNDFRKVSDAEKSIDYARVRNVLSDVSLFPPYLSIRNAYYNLMNFRNVDDERKSRSVRASLFYDEYGGLPNPVNVENPKTAIGDKNKGVINTSKIDQDSYAWLAKLAQFAETRGIRFLFVQSVLRQQDIKQYEEFLEQHIETLDQMAEKDAFNFFNYLVVPGLQSSHFYDDTHLNIGGSAILTRKLVEDAGLLRNGHTISNVYYPQNL